MSEDATRGTPARRPGPIANSYWLPEGRVVAGEYPGSLKAAEALEKISALLGAGVRVFLDVTTPQDSLDSYDAILEGESRRRGVPAIRVSMPVPDMDITSPGHMNRILDAIDRHTAEGRVVYVHCWGGVGRTGLVVGCHLVRQGLAGADALEAVRSLFGTMSPEKVRRHGGESPQTEPQRRMIVDWARHDQAGPGSSPTAAPRVSPRDRYLGALLGLAAGDALGTSLEFKAPGTFRSIGDMVGGGPFALAPGQWTDDTSMALCLAESLLERGEFDAVDQMRRYVRWMDEGLWSSTGRCFDIGNTVRGALEAFRRTGEGFSGPTDEQTAGNGSLMRLAPVPMYFAREPELAIQMAADSSRTTHGTAAAMDACRYFGGLLVGALGGVPKGELLSPAYTPVPGLWERAPLHHGVAAVARGSFRTKRPPAIRGTGHVVACLEAALWAFATTDDFESGALAAVNLGDDADTTGAVFGQIAGAHYGVHAIPAAWRQRLARSDEIERMAERLLERACI